MSKSSGIETQTLPAFLGFKSFDGVSKSGIKADISWLNEMREFPIVEQEGDNWCWAAVTAAIEQFCNGNKVDQCEVVKRYRDAGYLTDENGAHVDGNPCIEWEKFDRQGKIASALKVVCAIKVDRRERAAVPQPDIESFAVDHSNRSLPMPVMITYRTSGGFANNHYICIIGNASGPGKFKIFDPADGAGIFTGTIAELSDYDVSGTDGVWTNFFPWKDQQ